VFGRAEESGMKKLLLLTAIFAIASSFVVRAQQQEPSLKPSGAPKSSEATTQLLLEISYNPAVPSSYIAVQEKTTSVWVTRFVRIPGREMSPPIRAVKFVSKYNGETADVRVTLLRGPVAVLIGRIWSGRITLGSASR
jgi:hypothetical protein